MERSNSYELNGHEFYIDGRTLKAIARLCELNGVAFSMIKSGYTREEANAALGSEYRTLLSILPKDVKIALGFDKSTQQISREVLANRIGPHLLE